MSVFYFKSGMNQEHNHSHSHERVWMADSQGDGAIALAWHHVENSAQNVT